MKTYKFVLQCFGVFVLFCFVCFVAYGFYEISQYPTCDELYNKSEDCMYYKCLYKSTGWPESKLLHLKEYEVCLMEITHNINYEKVEK